MTRSDAEFQKNLFKRKHRAQQREKREENAEREGRPELVTRVSAPGKLKPVPANPIVAGKPSSFDVPKENRRKKEKTRGRTKRRAA